MRRLPIVLGLVVACLMTTDVARGQGALMSVVINAPGGLCLDVAGRWTSSSPPPAGTLLTLAVCDGSEDQRFLRCIGDCHDDLSAIGPSSVALRTGSTGRMVPAIGLPTDPRARIIGDELRLPRVTGGGNAPYTVLADLCITAPIPASPGAPLTAEVCDGRPGQRFTVLP